MLEGGLQSVHGLLLVEGAGWWWFGVLGARVLGGQCAGWSRGSAVSNASRLGAGFPSVFLCACACAQRILLCFLGCAHVRRTFYGEFQRWRACFPVRVRARASRLGAGFSGAGFRVLSHDARDCWRLREAMELRRDSSEHATQTRILELLQKMFEVCRFNGNVGLCARAVRRVCFATPRR